MSPTLFVNEEQRDKNMTSTVLLIDYDPRSIARIRKLLMGKGLRMLLATDGPAGVEKFRRSLPDLISIQDLLPTMHGFDACRAIKSTDEGKQKPVVILGRKGNRKARAESECDAHIDKPFKNEALIELVLSLLPEGFAVKPRLTIKRRPPRILVDFTEADVDERLDEVMANLAI